MLERTQMLVEALTRAATGVATPVHCRTGSSEIDGGIMKKYLFVHCRTGSSESDERLVLSGADEAGPAVEAITAFSKMRGLSLDDAKVQDWPDSPRENNC